METSKSKEMNHSRYLSYLDRVTGCVISVLKYNIEYVSLTPSAHFRHDLKMRPEGMQRLKDGLMGEFYAELHPDDLPNLKCCEDVAMYFCFDKKAARYSLQNKDQYRETLDEVIKTVRVYFKRRGSLKDLGMGAEDMGYLKDQIEVLFYTEIHPDDGSEIKCCEELAKYICYMKLAKDADRKAARKASADSSTSAPSCQDSSSYRACLAEVTEVVKEVSGIKEKIEPTADFKKDLGMDKGAVFVLFDELECRIPGCRDIDPITDKIYQLRCCQDVADYIEAEGSSISSGEDEDDDLWRV